MSRPGAAQALPLPQKLPVLSQMAAAQLRPAKAPSAAVTAIGSAVTSIGSTIALNPQPLPPKLEPLATVTADAAVLRTGSTGALAIGSATASIAAARAAFLH
jgi:hypothetical protein